MKIILGMHRSGTSLVAGLLSKSGLDFGNENNFIKADKHNPYGYYESKEIVRFNNNLLNGILGKIAYFFPRNLNKIKKRFERLKGISETLEYNYKNKFVKDNRFCITLRYWPKEVEYVIFVIRSPNSISASLNKRNFLTNSFSLKLWRYHILHALINTKNFETLFVSYENLIDPNKRLSELSKISRFILKKNNILIEVSKMNKILLNDFKIEKYSKLTQKKLVLDRQIKFLWKILQKKLHNDSKR